MTNALRSEQVLLNGDRTEAQKRAEFEALVDKSYRRAYNLAYRMTGNPLEAEDLTQETFVRAYRFFDRYNRSLAFEAWLRQIMHNLYVDSLRRKPKAQYYSLDQPLPGDVNDSETLVADFADPNANPEAEAMANEFSADVQKALNRLPVEFRQAVALCDIEGLSYDEIARTLNVSTGTVRSRIHRGRKMLRNLLGGGNAREERKVA